MPEQVRELFDLYQTEFVGGAITLAAAALAYLLSDPGKRGRSGLVMAYYGVVMTLLLGLRVDVVRVNAGLKSLPTVGPLNEILYVNATTDNKILERELERALSDLREHLDYFQAGKARIDPTDAIHYAKVLVAGARDRFLATSYVHNDQWWNTTQGKEYQVGNCEAVARGVEVRRVFILESDSDPGLGDLIEAQVECGIEIRSVLRSTLRRAGVEVRDVVVVDEDWAGELVLGQDGLQHALYYWDSDEIGRTERRFDDIWRSAEPVPEGNDLVEASAES